MKTPKKSVIVTFRLDEVLKEKGRGVREVARATDLTVATISRIVNHHTKSMSLEVIGKLCSELEITPNDLLKIEKLQNK